MPQPAPESNCWKLFGGACKLIDKQQCFLSGDTSTSFADIVSDHGLLSLTRREQNEGCNTESME